MRARTTVSAAPCTSDPARPAGFARPARAPAARLRVRVPPTPRKFSRLYSPTRVSRDRHRRLLSRTALRGGCPKTQARPQASVDAPDGTPTGNLGNESDGNYIIRNEFWLECRFNGPGYTGIGHDGHQCGADNANEHLHACPQDGHGILEPGFNADPHRVYAFRFSHEPDLLVVDRGLHCPGGFGSHRKCRRLHVGHTASPACAEDRPGPQRLKKPESLVADPGDQSDGIGCANGINDVV